MNRKYNKIIFLYIEIMKIFEFYNTLSQEDKIKIIKNFSKKEQEFLIYNLKYFQKIFKELMRLKNKKFIFFNSN